MGSKVLALGLLLAALMAAMLLVAKPAHAATFTVNQTGDQPDADLNDARCDVDPFIPKNQCTLRAAIQEANDTAGADTINFRIPGTGVKTIGRTNLDFPEITEAVTIDGYTQPGTSENTLAKGTNAVLLIELTPNGSGGNGLEVSASNTVIRGLVINRFSTGISTGDSQSSIRAFTGNRVEGNFIGTDPSGTVDEGNITAGVRVPGSASDSTVGGTEPEARNLISGNSLSGVQITGGGNLPPGNNTVAGNLIGVQKNGTSALGNGQDGVLIFAGSSGNTVGGTTAGAANTIAFNGEDGVLVGSDSATGNRILRNTIFSNGGSGIDLNDDGPTANDNKDPDTGPNNLQNNPVLRSAITSGTTTTIKGNLNSTPSTTFTVQFFSNPSSENEGKKFLGQKSVTTAADGKATFKFVPAQKVGVGQTITATATDPGGNTSEFSAPKTVVAQ